MHVIATYAPLAVSLESESEIEREREREREREKERGPTVLDLNPGRLIWTHGAWFTPRGSFGLLELRIYNKCNTLNRNKKRKVEFTVYGRDGRLRLLLGGHAGMPTQTPRIE